MTATAPPIREWARANGFTVGERGRLAPAIHAAYRAAHPEVERARPTNAAHCAGCGRNWTAAREAHCTMCHRHFSSTRWFDDHKLAPRFDGGRSGCRDPLSIPVSRRDSNPKFRIMETAWGEMYVSAAERPENFDYPDPENACDECGAPQHRSGGTTHRRGCSEAPSLF
jgi:hypothetical protein